LLASPSLAPTKLDELKIKTNILSSFAMKKAEDAYDAAASAVNDAKEGVESFAQKVKEEL
jgi:protein disulfide-isomerase A6